MIPPVRGLAVEFIRQLDVSAASGLITYQDKFYLVADDELQLQVYSQSGQGEGQSFQLLSRFLSEDKTLRKKSKPDFETLVRSGSQLLAIPSGSTAQRMESVSILLGSRGEILSSSPFMLDKVYSYLSQKLPQLNIEGAVIQNGFITLFQRGNGNLGQNALITMSLDSFLSNKPEAISIRMVDLGERKGIRLSFTDACLGWKNTFFFLAVAEASESTYLDGFVSGSVLGVMNFSDEIIEMHDLNLTSKPEGLDFDSIKQILYLVTDDDDRSIPSKLYQLNLTQLQE